SRPARPTIDIVDGNSGTVVSHAYIDRSAAPDGQRQAAVELTKDQAARAVDELEELGSVFAKMLIPHDQDANARLSVKFPKASADLLSGSMIEMEIAAASAHLVIPASSFQGAENELIFRIEPVPGETR